MYIMLNDFDKRSTKPNLGRPTPLRSHFRTNVMNLFGKRATVTTFGAITPVDGLGTTGGFNFIVEGRGNVPLEQLERVSEKIVDTGNKVEGLQDLFNSSGANTPWLYLDIDRTQCRTLGVQVSDIFNTLQVYMASYYVNDFNQFGRTWQVNIQADPRLSATRLPTFCSCRCAAINRARWSDWAPS